MRASSTRESERMATLGIVDRSSSTRIEANVVISSAFEPVISLSL